MMKVKVTKHGDFSLKMEEGMWEILERAVQKRLYEYGLGMEPYLWCLLKETLMKLQLRDSQSLRFRRSEFFAVFHQDTMEWVDEPTQLLFQEYVTPLYTKLLVQKNYYES